MTEKFVSDENGHVTKLHTVNVEWVASENGGFSPQKTPGSEKVWPTDLVLLAMGFLGPENTLIEKLAIEQDGRSNVKADEGIFKTNVDGVFAAGDMRRGQSLVVWAINEGRAAARECDRYLMGATQLGTFKQTTPKSHRILLDGLSSMAFNHFQLPKSSLF